MTDKLLLVSTCGTSLLTNDASQDDRCWLTKNANATKVDDPARLSRIIRDRREKLLKASASQRRRMSAELNGIGAVLDRYKPKLVFHLLVHTDTELGKTTAELVEQVLGDNTSLVTAGGLRTDDLASFRAALAALAKQIDEIVRGYQEKGWFVVFNLTAGFKSLNAYLQTLGMILAHRCVFLFEGASQLMEIPRLPVRLDELEVLREHAEVFRRLAVGYQVNARDAQGVPESLLIELDGQVATSVLGDVVWARHRDSLFAEQLHAPLSKKVRVSDKVRKAFKDLEKRHKIQVNEALDEFSARVDGVRQHLKSATFEQLQGNPAGTSTHELYAWSDGSASRLFGHCEGKGKGRRFVFDELTKHL